jgi:hypothetical protein
MQAMVCWQITFSSTEPISLRQIKKNCSQCCQTTSNQSMRCQGLSMKTKLILLINNCPAWFVCLCDWGTLFIVKEEDGKIDRQAGKTNIPS